MSDAARIAVAGVHKRFPGVHALNDVSLDARAGEVHAILGENGAGKSTLIRILSGIHPPDDGVVLMDGEPVQIANTQAAATLGISAVQQESQLVPYLSIAENVFLGHQPRGNRGSLDFRHRDQRAREILESVGVSLDVRAPVEGLSAAQAQMVSIGRAISVEARVVIFDEPTASLSPREAEALFAVIGRLRARGIAVIYISHRLEEVFKLADRITVLRDGRSIATKSVDSTDIDEVVAMMIGRPRQDLFVRGERRAPGPAVLRVSNLSVGERVRDVSLEVRAGELVCLFGLVGAGRTELVRAIFGADRRTSGTIEVAGRVLRRPTARRSIRAGLALAPEDRKGDGLVLDLPIRDNIALARIARPDGLVYAPGRVRRLAHEYVGRLQIKVPGVDRPVRVLSGGNQQRVVIAKWLTLRPRVLILDEPTQGIDVGAKAAIYNLIAELLAEQIGVLMVSSDLPEVVGVADRTLVMRQGEIVAEFSHEEASEDLVGRSALGTDPARAPAGAAAS